MSQNMFSKNDLDQIAEHGIAPDVATSIVSKLQQPATYVRLQRAATLQDGVRLLDNDVQELAAKAQQLQTIPQKFTPMSGAASRMFGFLARFLKKQPKPGDDEKMQQFLRAIDSRTEGPHFAFAAQLATVVQQQGKQLTQLIDDGELDTVVNFTLNRPGLGLAQLPKALVPFHQRAGRAVVPLEEQMKEALAYSGGRLHGTISAEHRELFASALTSIKAQNPDLQQVQVDFSEQHGSTDSLAIDVLGGDLVRDEAGQIAFFPAGHGALLTNIERLQGPAFLRNIDNVPKGEVAQKMVATYHRAFAVILQQVKQRVGAVLQAIAAGTCDLPMLDKCLEYMQTQSVRLLLDQKSYRSADLPTKIVLVKKALDRPIKIVGVVENQGEPGGGPFVIDHDGHSIISIVEKDEIAEDQKHLMRDGAYFNPVDLLVDPTNDRGESYPLVDFINADRHFIVEKPFRGRDVRRLEHPGLWNGAMDGWTSIFVVLPIETFAPVKEVVDTLRPQHQEP